jgi:tetratricopeptide (TPR) repeat protein
MDDRELRICFQVFLSIVMIIIFLFTGGITVVIAGLFMAVVLGYLFPSGIHFISNAFNTLIYGPAYSEDSYENRSYRDDMDRAKSLTREEEWNQAIHAYREIIQKSPTMYEPRFNLAKVYRRAGYLGLALNEYHWITDLKDQSGMTHPFVLESERAIEELEKMLSEMKQGSMNPPLTS